MTSLENNDIAYAKFIFNSKKTDDIELDISNLLPNSSLKYTFQVSNTSNNKKSDVSIKYKIYIESYRVIPLTFKIYLKSDPTNIILLCDNNSNITSDNMYLCTTNDLVLDYEEDTNKDYILEVIFPEKDENDDYWSEDYSNLVDYVNVKIKSWQKTN
jgi:hypothetical protein